MCIDVNEKGALRHGLSETILGRADEEDPAVEMLLAGGSYADIEEGDYVFRSGGACNVFSVLLYGTIRVQLSSPGGREVTLYRVTPGESCCVSTSCMFNRDAYPAEAIAETAIQAIAIGPALFRKALDCSPAFRQYVFDGYAANLASIIAKLELTSFTPVDKRLSDALLALDDRGENEVTHRALAAELGTAREVISRRLKQFESEGWIRLSRGRITISDRGGLESLRALSSFN